MVLNKMLLKGLLLGFLIILPVSGFGVASTPSAEPAVVDIFKPGNYYIDIAAQSWKKSNDESSTITIKPFINGFGDINEINSTNTGNSTGLIFDPNYNDFNIAFDDRSQVSAVPEPATLLLLGLGSLGLAAFRRRRQN